MSKLARKLTTGFTFALLFHVASCGQEGSPLEVPSMGGPTAQDDSDDTVGQDSTPTDDRSQIWLEALAGSELGARVSYTLEAGKTGPRVGEIVLKLSPSLRFVSAVTGQSLKDAGKELVAQPLVDGTVRLVFLSATNTQTLGSGDLATLQLERISNEPGKVEFVLGKPLFAPQEANDGLLVGAPLTL